MQILAKSYNVSNSSFTFVIKDEKTNKITPYTVDANHPKYAELKQAFSRDDAEEFVRYYTTPLEQVEKENVQRYVSNTGIEIQEDKILYNGVELHNVYCRRILEMKRAGMPIEPMVAFLENLLKNPSNRSREELPDFLANRNLPITEDGHFLAYKCVRPNYYSKSSGKLVLEFGTTDENGYILNAVGEVIRCNRADVDDERSNECSHGLHVGGLSYSGPGGSFYSHGDKVIIVKVNPADVVSVPKDYSAQKVRVCAYEVVGEYTEALVETVHGVEPATKSEWESIDLDDIGSTDYIKFDYPDGKTGVIETRYVVVDGVDEDYDDNELPEWVEGYVAEDDPSYEIGEEFRRFKTSKMSNIYINHNV